MNTRAIFDTIPFLVSVLCVCIGISNIWFHQTNILTWILVGVWIALHEILRRKWDKLDKHP